MPNLIKVSMAGEENERGLEVLSPLGYVIGLSSVTQVSEIDSIWWTPGVKKKASKDQNGEVTESEIYVRISAIVTGRFRFIVTDKVRQTKVYGLYINRSR